MRISLILLIFLILFNGWGVLLQHYHIDDQIGINANTGDAGALNSAVNSSQQVKTGNAIGQTLLGYYNSLLTTLKGMVLGLQPGLQLLVNVTPPGIATDMVIWAFGVLPIIIAVDLLSFLRGIDL